MGRKPRRKGGRLVEVFLDGVVSFLGFIFLFLFRWLQLEWNEFIGLTKSIGAAANTVARVATNNCDQTLLANDHVADHHDPPRLCPRPRSCGCLHDHPEANKSACYGATILCLRGHSGSERRSVPSPQFLRVLRVLRG